MSRGRQAPRLCLAGSRSDIRLGKETAIKRATKWAGDESVKFNGNQDEWGVWLGNC